MAASTVAEKPLTFRVAQDDKWQPEKLYKSTIKRDYPAHRLARQQRVPSPSPAIIVQREARIREIDSLTSSHFVKKVPEPVAHEEWSTLLRKTNFKMDSDERTKCFITTHNEYFPVRELDNNNGIGEDKMRSSLPQGDREKLMFPLSSYKHSYSGQDVTKIKPVQLCSHLSISAPILQGDPRTYRDQFETTSKTNFPTQSEPPRKLEPIKNNQSSIRLHGVADTEAYFSTTNQKFYKGVSPPCDRNTHCSHYYTNIVLGDNSNPRQHGSSWNNYSTTTGDCFPGKHSSTERVQKVSVDMGKSSLPEGDIDPTRQRHRVTQTTNKYFFPKPFVTSPNVIVSGANKRTKSDVEFGNDRPSQRYNTTMGSNFPAKSQAFKNYGRIPQKTSVPLNFGGNEARNSTTFTDFTPYSEARRLLPSAAALDKLKASHIKNPTTQTPQFLTTHNASFPPKQTKRVTYENGKLQKSSLPFGTLTCY